MHKQKPNNGQRTTTSDAIRARLKVRSGAHMVMVREDLQPGQTTDRRGTEHSSLTRAKKAATIGDAIVRVYDGVVVSVK